MEYSKLVSVTGLPGLFELVASKTDGAIVRSLDDKSTRFVSSRIHNFSHLESIEVYTEGDNVNLVDVFHAMQNNNAKLPDEKDAKAVKTYFEEVYPTMDFTRVYTSDMKKMVKWFDVLAKNNIEIKLTEPEADEEANEETVKEEVTTTENSKAESEGKETKSSKSSEKQEAGKGVTETSTEEKSVLPKKAKTAKTKKAEAVEPKEEAPSETEAKAAKKKITKK